jgi:hypothetical protein
MNDPVLSRQIRAEAQYYNITGLTTFFDPLRYPIETIGKENTKMKQNEDCIRRLFATDRENPLLEDLYLYLLPVFNLRETFDAKDPPPSIPLMFNFEGSQPFTANFPKPPLPRLTSSKEHFKKQFNAFTCGLFEGVDWSKMLVAGGVSIISN